MTRAEMERRGIDIMHLDTEHLSYDLWLLVMNFRDNGCSECCRAKLDPPIWAGNIRCPIRQEVCAVYRIAYLWDGGPAVNPDTIRRIKTALP